MFDVFFSDSAYGSVRAAYCWFAKDTCGKRHELISLPSQLSMGDISNPISEERDQYSPLDPDFLTFCFLSEQEAGSIDDEERSDEFAADCRRVKRLQTVRNWNTTIRIWVDDRPDTLCGTLFAASILEGGKCSVMINRPPLKSEDNPHRFWSTFEPKEIYPYLNAGTFLSDKEIHALAERWRTLQAENAVIRVPSDACGGVASAQADWYDKQIRRAIPEGVFRVNDVVGAVLASGEVLTYCSFPAWRLWKWMQSGQLAVVEKNNRGFFAWQLRRTEKPF